MESDQIEEYGGKRKQPEVDVEQLEEDVSQLNKKQTNPKKTKKKISKSVS